MAKQANKYRAVRTPYNGRTYASKAEADYARVLDKERGPLGIVLVIPQPCVMLAGIKYMPDFRVESDNTAAEYIDVKGYEPAAFKIKKRLWKLHGPGPLLIVKRVRGKFEVTEIINPEATR